MRAIHIIALTTFRESVRQPLFFILAGVAAALLLVYPFIPYFTFGEDIKMVKDNGMATITVCGLLLALFSASRCVAEEIDGKTAMTVLAKPVNRRQFILGKFFGLVAAVLLVFIILGLFFGATIFYKAGYDARESRGDSAEAGERWQHVWDAQPGMVLAFFQVVILTAISVAVSTRLPMLVNIVLCLAIAVLGHLMPLVVQASQGAFELVEFMAYLFATVLPALEIFNVGPAIALGQPVPWAGYVLWGFLYCVVYTTAAILLAFILFEDRDLA